MENLDVSVIWLISCVPDILWYNTNKNNTIVIQNLSQPILVAYQRNNYELNLSYVSKIFPSHIDINDALRIASDDVKTICADE